jgi:integrase
MTLAEPLDYGEQLVTIEQAAILLNCLKAAVHGLIKRGVLKAVGEGADLRVTLASVLTQIESLRQKGAEKTIDEPGTSFFDKSKNLWYAQSAPDKYKDREKSLGFKTKEGADAWRAQYEQDIRDKMKRDWAKRKFKDFLEYWLEKKRESGKLTPATIRSYSQKIRLYSAKYVGHIPLGEFEPEDWEFLEDRLQEENEEKAAYAPNTILNTYRCLKTAFNWAVRQKYIRENPLDYVEAPSGGRIHQPVALTQTQVELLLTTIYGHRLYALYLLAVRLGLRQGELIALRRKNVDLEKGELHVVEQLVQNEAGEWVFDLTKNKKSRRIPLPADIIQALRIHFALIDLERAKSGSKWEDWDLVFPSEVGTPLSARNLVRHFKGILKKAGLPERMHFHDLRHTAGSLMLNAGDPLIIVSAMLGHSSPQITANIYAHADDDTMRRTIENAAKRFERRTDNEE